MIIQCRSDSPIIKQLYPEENISISCPNVLSLVITLKVNDYMLKTVYFLWFQHYGVALEKRCPNCLSYNIILEFIVSMIHNLPIIPKTRIQSCETLKLCITSYGIGCTEEHLVLIWNDVKQEIFGGVNKDLRER